MKKKTLTLLFDIVRIVLNIVINVLLAIQIKNDTEEVNE